MRGQQCFTDGKHKTWQRLVRLKKYFSIHLLFRLLIWILIWIHESRLCLRWREVVQSHSRAFGLTLRLTVHSGWWQESIWQLPPTLQCALYRRVHRAGVTGHFLPDVNPSWQHNQHCYLLKRQDFPLNDTRQWPNMSNYGVYLHRNALKTFRKMKTQTQTQNKLAHSSMRIDMSDPTFVASCEWWLLLQQHCPQMSLITSAKERFLFNFWYMFWRDNFLAALIRASPGRVLKVFFSL